RIVIPRIEKWLCLSAAVQAARAASFCPIASRTTERQVAHDGQAAAGAGHDMFDVKGNTRRSLQQPAILASPASASFDELLVSFSAGHTLALRGVGLNPNGDRQGPSGRAGCIGLGKLRQLPGVGNHQFLSFGYEMLERGLFLGGDGTFAVFLEQPVKPPLLGGGELPNSWRRELLHRRTTGATNGPTKSLAALHHN